MEWVVTTGKTVEEAKDAALDELGVDEVDAEFEVLEEPRQGLFGRQRGEARIRARVRPTAPRPKAERGDRRRRRPADGAPRPNARPDKAEKTEAVTAESEDASGDDAGEDSSPSPAKRRRSGRSRSGAAAPAGASTNGAASPDAAPESDDDVEPMQTRTGGAPVPEEELSLAEQGQLAEQFISGLLERFGAEAEVTVVDLDEDMLEVQVTGAELGLLIGPKGQTLQAVQELTRTVVQRRSVARTGRILVDIAGYRVRRREALERFTQQQAARVLESGMQCVLEPMSAADRKVVHDTANEIDGVRTVSEGEDPHRRVVILPAAAAAADEAG
jgi:spoIIIJ-associated protein